jgi:hypothetical protein
MVGDERLVGFLNRPVVHAALRRERRLLVAANRALIDRLAQRLDEHDEMTESTRSCSKMSEPI